MTRAPSPLYGATPRPEPRPDPGPGRVNKGNAPVRVVFHHDSHGYGGMELYLFRLIEHLDRSRCAPALLVPGFQGDFRSSDERVLDEARDRGIAVLRPPDPTRRRGPAPLNELVAIARILHDSGAEVVHIHTCRPTGARKVTVATRLARVRGLLRTEHFPPSVTSGPADRFRVKPLDWLTDCVVTGSQGDRAEQISLLRRKPDKVLCCYNSIDLDRCEREHDVARAKERLGLDPEIPVVGNVGRLVDQKAQRFLIEAFSHVLQRCGPVNLLIVGDGPLRAELEALSEELGVARRVHFVGFQDDVIPFMQAMDVGAMPSLFEVFSLAMLELMALGKPVVASDHSSFLEAIEHGREGLIVPRGQSAPLADALVGLLDDPELRATLGAAAARRIRANFGLERLVGEMMDLYEIASGAHAG
jgi:glycosyltransferase involved in cell wall biosynthesis